MSQWPPKLLLLLCLGLAGCQGQLVQALEERQLQSCLWWSGPLIGHGVTATGGVDIKTCLAVPCQLGH